MLSSPLSLQVSIRSRDRLMENTVLQPQNTLLSPAYWHCGIRFSKLKSPPRSPGLTSQPHIRPKVMLPCFVHIARPCDRHPRLRPIAPSPASGISQYHRQSPFTSTRLPRCFLGLLMSTPGPKSGRHLTAITGFDNVAPTWELTIPLQPNYAAHRNGLLGSFGNIKTDRMDLVCRLGAIDWGCFHLYGPSSGAWHHQFGSTIAIKFRSQQLLRVKRPP